MFALLFYLYDDIVPVYLYLPVSLQFHSIFEVIEVIETLAGDARSHKQCYMRV